MAHCDEHDSADSVGAEVSANPEPPYHNPQPALAHPARPLSAL